MADDMDAETLQTSFDLSFAAIHDVAASWVGTGASSSSHINAQKELEDYMKRPPRLGVGAPMPESTSLSRETARLKHQLGSNQSKKRTHERLADTADSDNEEESRAGAISKKVKNDPFAPRLALSQSETRPRDKPITNTGKQGAKSTSKVTLTDDVTSALNLIPNAEHNLSDPDAPAFESCLVSGTEKSSVAVEALSGNSVALDSKSNNAAISVLNLEGPPAMNLENSTSSPRKKRKRRKKKKGMMAE